jgi:fibronectin type 3 domain-containing protein
VPTGLQIVPGATSASLTWISVPTAASYKVYRGSSSTGPWTRVNTPAVATYTDQGLSSSTTYWYAVSSVGADGTESAKCVAVSTTTLSAAGDTTPPTVPTWASPAITADVVASGVMELRWNASTDAGVGMQDYRIWRSNDGSTGWTVIATWTNLLSLVYDDTVGPSQTRYYRITARDVSLNESAASSTVSATTAAAISQWTLTITNTINGANKNRYVWVQNVTSSLYYNQAGGTSATPPTGVVVPSKNGTASFSLLPNGVYNIWVSSSAASKPGSGASVQTSVTINGANSGANIS